ncbi:MAG: (Na+)-NQR maturation NqrM [Moraxella sp.]|nr:(Na+)-NQR maturation NqrM [Moraxella sp.]
MSDLLYQFVPIFFITFGVFALFFLLMGIGYLVKKQPLKGSCGGVANLMGDEYCQFCGNDPNKCENNQKAKSQAELEKLSKIAKEV